MCTAWLGSLMVQQDQRSRNHDEWIRGSSSNDTIGCSLVCAKCRLVFSSKAIGNPSKAWCIYNMSSFRRRSPDVSRCLQMSPDFDDSFRRFRTFFKSSFERDPLGHRFIELGYQMSLRYASLRFRHSTANVHQKLPRTSRPSFRSNQIPNILP